MGVRTLKKGKTATYKNMMLAKVRENSQKASSREWDAFRFTRTTTGLLSSLVLEEPSPAASIDLNQQIAREFRCSNELQLSN